MNIEKRILNYAEYLGETAYHADVVLAVLGRLGQFANAAAAGANGQQLRAQLLISESLPGLLLSISENSENSPIILPKLIPLLEYAADKKEPIWNRLFENSNGNAEILAGLADAISECFDFEQRASKWQQVYDASNGAPQVAASLLKTKDGYLQLQECFLPESREAKWDTIYNQQPSDQKVLEGLIFNIKTLHPDTRRDMLDMMLGYPFASKKVISRLGLAILPQLEGFPKPERADKLMVIINRMPPRSHGFEAISMCIPKCAKGSHAVLATALADKSRRFTRGTKDGIWKRLRPYLDQTGGHPAL